MNREELRECIDKSVLDSERYSDTVKVYYLLKKSLEDSSTGFELKKIERVLRKQSDNSQIELDMLIKSNTSSYTIFEFTTSVSHNKQEYLEKEVKKIIDRDSDFIDGSTTISISDVILVCHQDDAQFLLETYKNMINEGKIQPFSRNFCIIIYYFYKNTGEEDTLNIKWFYGDPKGNAFLYYLKNQSPKYSISKLSVKMVIEQFHFTNKKPPIPYLCSEIESSINSLLNEILRSPKLELKVTLPIDDFIKKFKERTGNDYCGPKSEWIREGLPYLEKIGLIKLEKDSFIVYVDEFENIHRNTDRYRFYAKLKCKTTRQAKPTKRPSLSEAEKSHHKPLFDPSSNPQTT